MAKKPKTSPRPPSPPPQPASLKIAPLVLVTVAAFFSALVALYQWMELIVARAGGDLTCSINAALDCAPVWSSSFAKDVGAATGIPVAGWGLTWGIAAFVAAVGAWIGAVRKPGDPTAAHVVRILAAGGLLAVITLFIVSVGIGVLCPTCLVTYLSAIAYAVGAAMLPGPIVPRAAEAGRALMTAAAVVIVAYVALLLPTRGSPTALQAATALPIVGRDAGTAPQVHAPAGGPVAEFIQALEPSARQMLSDHLNAYRTGKLIPRSAPERFRAGSPSAPVHIIEWLDIRCGHCAQFTAALKEMSGSVHSGMLSVEPRQFPLDKECNEAMNHTDGTGIRCAAARALICLEGTDAFWRAQEQMFLEQQSLTQARVVEIAASHARDKPALASCMKSPDTAAKLRDDIRYALTTDLHGTPQVLINGREAQPAPALIYALVLAGGDPAHPAFQALPAPRPLPVHKH